MTTKTWQKPSGDWSDTGSWTGGPPGAGDAVVIDTASPVTVTFDAGAPSVAVTSLTVGAQDTFDVASAGALTITGSARFGGPLEIDSGTLDLGPADATAASFVQTGGTMSGTGTLTVTGAAMVLRQAGQCDQETGAGTTRFEGVTRDSGVILLDGGRTLENAGTLTVVAGGAFTLGANANGAAVGGGEIVNDAGATFDFETASSVLGGLGATAFVNAGRLEQTVATGLTDIAVALTNTGVVSAQTGTLRFDAGGTSSAAGAFTVASGATIDFDGGTFTSSSSFSGGGAVEVTGGALVIDAAAAFGGLLEVDGATLDLGAANATAASFTQTFGLVSGSGVLTVTGPATFNGGFGGCDAETGPGTTLLEGATTDCARQIALDGGRVLENAGTFTVKAASGYSAIRLGDSPDAPSVGGGTILNDAGATFDFQTASSVLGGLGATDFVNAGQLEQTVATGLTDIAVALTNSGLVSAQTGTLRFDAGGTSSAAGAFFAASGATLDFDAGTFTSSSSFSGPGVVDVTGGALVIGAAATFGGLLEVDAGILDLGTAGATAASFTQTGGLVSGAGGLTVTGAATFSGGSDEESGAGTTLLLGVTTDCARHLTLDGGRVLENAGTLIVNAAGGYGSVWLGDNPDAPSPDASSVDGGAIQNDAGATFDFQSASSVLGALRATAFVNAGTVEQTVTTGTADIEVALTNTGLVSAATGALRFGAGGTSAATGAFAVTGGATLDFAGGTFTLLGGTIGGAGAVEVMGGALAIGASFSDAADLNLTTGDGGALALNGATLTLAGAANALSGTITGTGTLKVTGAAILTDVTAGAAGAPITIDDAGSVTLAGADTVAGALQIEAGAAATIAGTLSAGTAVTFAGAGATLILDDPARFAGVIGGVGFDDTIVLKGIVATSATVDASNQLVVMDGGTTVATLALSPAATGLAFVTQAVTGGTNVMVAQHGAVTVARYLAAPALFDQIPGGVSIRDTAANIGAALGSLTDPAITAILVTDSAPVGPTDPPSTGQAPTALSIAGNVLTQTYADGAKDVSTFGIAGQAFTNKTLAYDANGALVSKLYRDVTGQGNLSAFEYRYAGGSLVATWDLYTGITGQAYTTEETDYDGAGRLVCAAFSNVSGAPYSAYAYDYVGGVFAGSTFTYTTAPSGASYSSYEVDYDEKNALAGERFVWTGVTGQDYTGEEADIDAGGSLTSVLLTGFRTAPYASLELDYAAGAYEGYKAFYDIAGQSFAHEEVDVSASGALEKVIYSGMTATPYASVEQDYSGGALSTVTYDFTGVTGQTYNAYQVTDDASGAALQETLDLNSGGHSEIALAARQTLTSLGNDKMTGSAAGSTHFVLNAIYGADTIASLTNADTVSLPASEFASFAALTSAATQSGANVVIAAADGDTLTLKNLTTAALAGMGSCFTFHT